MERVQLNIPAMSQLTGQNSAGRSERKKEKIGQRPQSFDCGEARREKNDGWDGGRAYR